MWIFRYFDPKCEHSITKIDLEKRGIIHLFKLVQKVKDYLFLNTSKIKFYYLQFVHLFLDLEVEFLSYLDVKGLNVFLLLISNKHFNPFNFDNSLEFNLY